MSSIHQVTAMTLVVKLDYGKGLIPATLALKWARIWGP